MVALSKKARRNDGLNEKIDDKDSDSSVVANKKSDGVVSATSSFMENDTHLRL